ncbi:hypothetical protein [Mycobacterium sp. 155]|uniref:hypothetical protein n=1 Tax=Mycobacterium sp. 155 TaxID=1157943 RepID=UPI00036FBDA3|nr:hypothetical protein [Mycobacterium sp. 155]
MERLPYIDEHATTIDADAATTWAAVLRVLCGSPTDPRAPLGFRIAERRPPERLVLAGRHPFSIYEWVFELDVLAPNRTRVRSQTWAAFPRLHGKIYRALVIGSGGHRVIVRWMLNRIADQARPRGVDIRRS